MREELVKSAISFLHDPAVANAPLNKKVEFLQSKDLTEDEIREALNRVGDNTTSDTNSSNSSNSSNSGNNPATNPSISTQNGILFPVNPEPPVHPPPVPQRDWRDLFIMSIVSVGVGYGIYTLAKTYILPLIKPPSKNTIEQDKKDLLEEIEKLNETIKVLKENSENLVKSDKERTQKLEECIKQVNDVTNSIETQENKRNIEIQKMKEEVLTIRDRLPHSLAKQENNYNTLVKDIQKELTSLKQLFAARTNSNTNINANGNTNYTPESPVDSFLEKKNEKTSIPDWQKSELLSNGTTNN